MLQQSARILSLLVLFAVLALGLVSVAAAADIHPGGWDPGCTLCQFKLSPSHPSLDAAQVPEPAIHGVFESADPLPADRDGVDRTTEARGPPSRILLSQA